MLLFIKALFGGFIVVLIALLSTSKHYYIAGLVPLFPTFTLIAHYSVGVIHNPAQMKATILFSMFSTIPYMMYLASSYYLIDRMSLKATLGVSVIVWCLGASVLLYFWPHPR